MRGALAATVTALFLAAIAPTPASADHGEQPYSPFYSRAMEIARNYWNDDGNGVARCPDLVASFATPHLAYYQDPNPYVWAHSEKPGCRIWLDVDWWSNTTRSNWHCEAIVHEYGHLMGFDDSADPASVMYPNKYGGKVFSCYEFGPAPVWDAPATSTPPNAAATSTPTPSPSRPAEPPAKLQRKRKAVRRCRIRYRHRPAARKRCIRRVRS